MTDERDHPDESVRVRFTPYRAKAGEVVEAQFTQDEWGKLRDFASFAQELRATSLLNRKRQSGFRFSVEGDRSLSDATRAEIHDLAMALRPFLLNNEHTNFNHVKNILSRAIDHPAIRERLDELRSEFDGRTSRRNFELRGG